jgi:hypothetical protein
MPSVNCTTIRTPSLPGLYPFTTLVRDAGTIKGYRVATISWFADKSACCCCHCRCFYRLSLYYRCIASYAIAMAFPFTSSSRTSSLFEHSIQHLIQCSILEYSASSLYNRSRLPLFDTSPGTFYELPCTGILPSLFSHTTRAFYEDEHKSDTPF